MNLFVALLFTTSLYLACALSIQAGPVAMCKGMNISESMTHKYFHGMQHRGYVMCNENYVVVTADTHETLKNCYRKTYFVNNKTKSEVSSEERMCPFVCMAQSQGMMDSNGKINRARIHKFFETPIPTLKTLELVALIFSCVDAYEHTVDLKPGNCSSAEPLFRCAFEKVLKACGVDVHNLDQWESGECVSNKEDSVVSTLSPQPKLY